MGAILVARAEHADVASIKRSILAAEQRYAFARTEAGEWGERVARVTAVCHCRVSLPCVAAVCRCRVPPSVFGTRELYRGRGASGGAGVVVVGIGGERLRAQLERVVAPVVILGRGRHLRAHGHPQRRAARV